MARKKFLRLANAINRGEYSNRLDFDDNGMFVREDGLDVHISLDEPNGKLVLWCKLERVEAGEEKILAEACVGYTARKFAATGCVFCAAGNGLVALFGQSIALAILDTKELVRAIKRFAGEARRAFRFLMERLTTERVADAERLVRQLSTI